MAKNKEYQQRVSREHSAATAVDVSGLPVKEIVNQYGVSRTTAWRAQKTGKINPTYHIRKRALSPFVELRKVEQYEQVEETKPGLFIHELVFEHFPKIQAMAMTTYKDMLKGVCTFEEYWDIAFDILLDAKSPAVNRFWGYAKGCLVHAAFRVIQKKKNEARLKAGLWVDDTESGVFIGESEITNPIETANWIREQIISTHGLKAWNEVWKWLRSKRRYCPPEIQAFLKF